MTAVDSRPRTRGARTSQRRLRLLKLIVLVVGITIAGRLVWLQTAQADEYQARAQAIQSDIVPVAPARGDIVDRTGVILAGNRTAHEVVAEADVTAETLERVAELTGVPLADIEARMVVCGQPGSQAGTCYAGQPGQPLPVVVDLDVPEALAVRDADLPGVSVRSGAVRDYPSMANAAGLLGYVVAGEGKSGLEAEYDEALRGTPGEARRQLTRQGTSRTEITTAPIPGQTLVTSLDARTQAVAEKALKTAVDTAREEGFKATGGSVVVLEAGTGEVVAMASYPTYDPNIWAHGVTNAQYAELTDEKSGRPLVFRPTQAVAPPASTFKSLTTVAAANAGFDLDGTYECPASVTVGGQVFRNFESRAYGPVSLAEALSVSCDTVFYRLGYQMWKRDGGLEADAAAEDVVRTASSFGLGATTGVDLPGEVQGSIPDRAQVRAEYEQRAADYCLRAKQGYPEERPVRAKLLKAYARDYCKSGFEYKAGDAMNTAIGQGRTLATPLQVAAAYAAIANGGRLVTPHIGQELRGAESVELGAADRGRVDATQEALDYVRDALADTTVTGTARWAFAGYPNDEFPVAAKTGTAEVAGKQSTSWFASFAPADDPQYVVVVNVDQGGLGAATSGPVARAVYEQLFGITR
jgi:penicillin-binding protein 2